MKKFDLYWAHITFKEDELNLAENKREKLRPALILDPDIHLCLVVEITSHSKRDRKDYSIIQWKEAGLQKPSVIRFSHKLNLSHKAMVEYIGHLTPMDINKIREQHLDESLINESENDFDARWDFEFMKYSDQPLTTEEFHNLMSRMINSSLTESTANSNGVYSLLQNKWLKVPVKDDVPDNVDLEPELSQWMERANNLLNN